MLEILRFDNHPLDMATISNVRANFGLIATGTPSYPTATGAVSLGTPNTTARLTECDVFNVVEALVFDQLNYNPATGATTGSTAWVAGSPQVESATLSLGTGTSGNLNVVVTSSGMTGSPLTVPVAIDHTVQTTAALVAQKIVDTLNANTVVAARFTATRSTATVVLTRKPSGTYTVGSNTVNTYIAGNADDFVIPSALGITGAASTTGSGANAGVATAGCYIVGAGEDFEGNAATISNILAILIENSPLSQAYMEISQNTFMSDLRLDPGDVFNRFRRVYGTSLANDVITIIAAETSLVRIIVAGEA
jgi:hypothetical protein